MTIEIVNIYNRDITVIRADEGKVFKRKHDGFIMGTEIFLGRELKGENYYERRGKL